MTQLVGGAPPRCSGLMRSHLAVKGCAGATAGVTSSSVSAADAVPGSKGASSSECRSAAAARRETPVRGAGSIGVDV